MGKRISSNPLSLAIAASFIAHSTMTSRKADYDIVINPQMAFGTGHHETTSLIIGELLDNNLQGKVLARYGLRHIYPRHIGTHAWCCSPAQLST